LLAALRAGRYGEPQEPDRATLGGGSDWSSVEGVLGLRPTELTGWGRSTTVVGSGVEVTAANAAAAIKAAPERGILARGLGRSYGDAAQNAGGAVLWLRDGLGGAELDTERHLLTVGAGIDLDALLQYLVPRGYFLPVTPGTRFVTIGGAIASDIHGKNHHLDGSFGNHVERLSLLISDGTVLELSRQRDPEAFWATIGGMGLTGVILDATIRLLPIQTSRLSVETRRIGDLDTLLQLMSEGDHLHRYSVAWVDLMATGRNLGRSVLTWGDHATIDQLDLASVSTPLEYRARQLVSVPRIIPPAGVLNRWTVGAFNEMWFRRAPRHRVDEIQTIPSYFHPLDLVGSWNRLYGRSGFLQYQFLVPFGAESTLRQVIERISASGATSFLAVLKRFGAANPAPLSFPRPGWTLALDVPAASSGLAGLLHGLDELILGVDGRHYLAKDAQTTPSAIRAGYVRLDEWRHTRDRLDPAGIFRSDLGRRLGLIDGEVL